jgi:hypothetical protein
MKRGGGMEQWLIAHFSFLGVDFQNWMPVAAGIVALFSAYQWISERM